MVQRSELDFYFLKEHMCAQRMGLIELVGQDFRHGDRRPFSDPLHRRDLLAEIALSRPRNAKEKKPDEPPIP